VYGKGNYDPKERGRYQGKDCGPKTDHRRRWRQRRREGDVKFDEGEKGRNYV
jgi:hypothetical protein